MPEKNGLSEREIEILSLVATGASNKEIAQSLVISTNTVKVHLKNIFNKIGAASRTEAAMYAVNAGIIEGGTGSNGAETQAGESESFFGLPGWVVIGSIVLIVILVISLSAFFINRSLANPQGDELVSFSSEWAQMKALPTARFGHASAVYENFIFAISGATDQGETGTVERYDPATDSWSSFKDKPVPVRDVSGTVIGGQVYIPGGKLSNGELTDILEVYDPADDEWFRGEDLPVPISGYGLTSFEGKLYLFGGWDGQKYLDVVYEYDPESDTWNHISSMPTPRAHPGISVVGSKIYIIGGLNKDGAVRENEVFIPDAAGEGNEAWEIGTPLPVGGYGMGTTSVADSIYLVGGIDQDGGQFASLVFDPLTGEWGSLSEPASDFGSFLGLETIGTKIYGIGGKVGEIPQDNNFVYQAMFTISIPLISK